MAPGPNACLFGLSEPDSGSLKMPVHQREPVISITLSLEQLQWDCTLKLTVKCILYKADTPLPQLLHYLEALSDNNFWMSWKKRPTPKNPLRTKNLVSTRIAALYCFFFVHHVRRIWLFTKKQFGQKSRKTDEKTHKTDEKTHKTDEKTRKLFYSLGWCVSACSCIKVFLIIKWYKRLRTKKNVSDEKDPNVQKYLSECIRTEKKDGGGFQV